MNKDFLTLADFTRDELEEILSRSKDLKNMNKKGLSQNDMLTGKTMGMIFTKPSTRTRLSFQAGMFQLGGQAMFLSKHDLQWGQERSESMADTARVFSRFVDVAVIRTYEQAEVEQFAQYATIPVINALTDLLHPCQALSDIFTIREKCGENLHGLKVTYVGDGNNVAHSLMLACAKFGIDIFVATPKNYEPKAMITEKAKKFAQENNSKVVITNDPIEAVDDADVIYTDTWVSMGEEDETNQRLKLFTPYQVNEELVSHANRRAFVMHCLPAHKGEEITYDVFEKNADHLFDQAENRLHVQKGILTALVKK